LPTTNLPDATWKKLPRWRGFNLLNQYSKDWSHRPFAEDDFRLIHRLGFNFVRLPMDYRIWIKEDNWNEIDEKAFGEIDQAVEWGPKYGIHICLNFHRAPGYCINPPVEKESLWVSEEAQKVCAKHWAYFAKRYKGHPNRELSFDLLNEPTGADNTAYALVAGILCDAIRSEDPERLIICDGNEAGTVPVEELIPLRVAQSTRGYQPFNLTHYRAPWVEGADQWMEPTWPMFSSRKNGALLGAACHWEECVEPWKALEAKGVGVMVGEWGVYNQTPHDVTMRFAEAVLSNWRKAGWGWALWNFTGDFGPLDSKREDVAYENWEGHLLDREMMKSLRKY
jgi:endoglucanase